MWYRCEVCGFGNIEVSEHVVKFYEIHTKTKELYMYYKYDRPW